MAAGAVYSGYVAPDDLTTQVAIVGTALFFSLFPDLDTASVAQRWFFRSVFCTLLYLGWTEHYELATLIGILCVLPLLDHHRGWTHWKISPFITVGLLGTSYEYWRARQAFLGEFTWDNVHTLLEGHCSFLYCLRRRLVHPPVARRALQGVPHQPRPPLRWLSRPRPWRLYLYSC